jgi:hypothetical protein
LQIASSIAAMTGVLQWYLADLDGDHKGRHYYDDDGTARSAAATCHSSGDPCGRHLPLLHGTQAQTRREQVVRRLRTFVEDAYNFEVNGLPCSVLKVWKIETKEFRSAISVCQLFPRLLFFAGCIGMAQCAA